MVSTEPKSTWQSRVLRLARRSCHSAPLPDPKEAVLESRHPLPLACTGERQELPESKEV
jgi:hypothetical protein